ncbi:uncharacterized protein VTP21DRAFT_5797 [Calcarisporiella thermophila]|uniref:uncharacterized protein n=1 Tax=Calcarisporiella thermophila TaxID=911321 RepID=UPI003742A631
MTTFPPNKDKIIRSLEQKPLPDLPVYPDAFASHSLLHPFEFSQDVQFDLRAISHLYSLLEQLLLSVSLDPVVWKRSILNLLLDVIEQVPHAISVIVNRERGLYHKLDQTKTDLEEVCRETSSTKQAYEEKIPSLYSAKRVSYRVYIMRKVAEKAEARFVHGEFFGESLFTPTEGDYDGPDLTLVGGTIQLHGPLEQLTKVERVMEVMLHFATSLKLEMYLLRDHHANVTRGDPEEARKFEKSIQNHQRQSEMSLFGILVRNGVRAMLGALKTSVKRRSLWFNSPDKPDFSPSSSRISSIHSTGKAGETLTEIRNIANTEVEIEFPDTPLKRATSLIEQMQCTIISSSPDVYFPPPQLLLRLHNKEREINKTSFCLPISVDIVVGLKHLLWENNLLDRVIRHQSITYSFSCRIALEHPCDGPRLETLKYYQHGSDRTLQEMITFWCEAASTECPACHRSMSQHIRSYTHGSARVNMSLQAFEGSEPSVFCPNFQFTPNMYDRGDIALWTECKMCTLATPITLLSEHAQRYSFGKYLELLLYSPINPIGSCSHQYGWIRKFRRRDIIVTLSVEAVDLFEMRVPRLQLQKCPIIEQHNEEREEAERVRIEVTSFFADVRRKLNVLKCHIAQHKGHSITPEMIAQLIEIAGIIDKDEPSLYAKLKDGGGINDVRNLFVKKIQSIKKRVEDWLLQCAQDIEEVSNFEWILPEYYSMEKIHLFPHSRVIVREDEPSSLIAFTLNSADYLRELALLAFDNNSKAKRPSLSLVRRSVSDQTMANAYNRKRFLEDSGLKKEDTKKQEKLNGDNMKEDCVENLKVKQRLSSAIEDKDDMRGSDRIPESQEKNGYYTACKLVRLQKSTRGLSINSFAGVINVQTIRLNTSASSKPTSLPAGKTSSELIGNDQSTEQQKILASDMTQKEDLAMPKSQLEYTGVNNPVSYDTTSKDSRYTEEDPSHLKLKFRHGDMYFSCTVYYALQFDTLRRRCGVNGFVDSLSRCISWQATGGKSRSLFFKTRDDRLIIKQMINTWNLDEMSGVLRFAPQYFAYMERTSEYPTLLAKVFGVYTIKIKNVRTGYVQKFGVQVMENIFWGQKITRKFDLKGIQGRYVGPKTALSRDTTLWDGDWVEGQYKNLLLVHSYSERIIRESIQNDTQFLADANIMDYSLLAGVNDEQKELIVGIVDYVGAYTWYKKLESRSKKTLRGNGKDVTVIPPEQYKKRFREAMEQYFLAIPDKWFKPLDEDSTQEAKISTQTMNKTSSHQNISMKSASSIFNNSPGSNKNGVYKSREYHLPSVL